MTKLNNYGLVYLFFKKIKRYTKPLMYFYNIHLSLLKKKHFVVQNVPYVNDSIYTHHTWPENFEMSILQYFSYIIIIIIEV